MEEREAEGEDIGETGFAVGEGEKEGLLDVKLGETGGGAARVAAEGERGERGGLSGGRGADEVL